MEVTIQQSTGKGTVKAQPSKSIVHRLLILAMLSPGKSVIGNVAFSEDILATMDCMKALGASVSVDQIRGEITVEGTGGAVPDETVDLFCRESGSTMRFFMGIAMTLGIHARFFGSTRLLERPFSVYEEISSKQKITFVKQADHIEICGKLEPGTYHIPGNISSQFVTGLLFGLPLRETDSEINLIPPVESLSYIELTLQALSAFSANVSRTGNTIVVPGSQSYRGNTITAEGDYSNAAFPDALNLLGGSVSVTGLDENSRQGDRVYREYFEKLKSGYAKLDISDCPDLGPVLFALAACLNGAEFTGTARLKMKESDRGLVMCEELKKCGISSVMEENRICIAPGLQKPQEPLCGHNDHRIVMALAVLLTKTGGTISGAEAVRKSYPSFFEDLKSLGIVLDINQSCEV